MQLPLPTKWYPAGHEQQQLAAAYSMQARLQGDRLRQVFGAANFTNVLCNPALAVLVQPAASSAAVVPFITPVLSQLLTRTSTLLG
jgi:hypothetical protein